MSRTSLKSSASALIASAFLLSAGATAQAEQAVPRFVVLPNAHLEMAHPPSGGLTLWNWNYTYKGTPFSDQFVGTVPSGGASTTTPTFIIPIKIVLSTGATFTTSTAQPNGQTALADTIASPIFASVIDFTEGSANLGTTQYTDAFQRESFWATVKLHKGYHTLLGAPTVLPEVTLNVPASKGHSGTPFGHTVAEVDINYLDVQIQGIIAANPQITASSVPIFVMYNNYQTSGGCCIGGYHSANGAQSYAVFDYIGFAGDFAQDVSALSHEMSEWLDDPLTNNNSPCGIYEVGDPLEREANFGGFPYVANGMTYNLQDEAQPPYFGAPKKTSLANRASFQGTALSVCQNGA